MKRESGYYPVKVSHLGLWFPAYWSGITETWIFDGKETHIDFPFIGERLKMPDDEGYATHSRHHSMEVDY